MGVATEGHWRPTGVLIAGLQALAQEVDHGAITRTDVHTSLSFRWKPNIP